MKRDRGRSQRQQPKRKAHGKPTYWRPIDLDGPPSMGTVDAVRRVVKDWDGTNWDTVWTFLRGDGLTSEEIKLMTESVVRQWFAVYQNRMILTIGGLAETAANAIVSCDSASASSATRTPEVSVRNKKPENEDTPTDLIGFTKAASIVHEITGDECSDDTIRRRTRESPPLLKKYKVAKTPHLSEAEVRANAFRMKKTVGRNRGHRSKPDAK